MWDVFCKVVDNYGDVGVCWRLARQLAVEHGAEVRLWLDDVGSLARIWPGIDAGARTQHVQGIDVRRWDGDSATADTLPGDVVIEAFGCDIPESYVAAMARREPRPAWFNLEYLSAEDWVETHHLLPSPHPRLPLVKAFYFPGFTGKTGGLLRENGLLERRDVFQRDPAAIDDFWRGLRLPAHVPDELRVSIFAYANPAAPALFDAWSRGGRPVIAVVPDGVLEPEVAEFLGSEVRVGEAGGLGNLRIVRIPFVSQTDYDRLLWACDFNFVRGEDSFVRAQWAGRPFVWHIYPQAACAHGPKLAAFVARYAAALDEPVRAPMAALFDAWNGLGRAAASGRESVAGAVRDAGKEMHSGLGTAWADAAPLLEPWTQGAARWAVTLASRRDLASQLAEKAGNKL